MLTFTSVAIAQQSLSTKDTELRWLIAKNGGVRPQLVSKDGTIVPAKAALVINLLPADEVKTERIEADYKTVRSIGKSLVAVATIATPGGSTIDVTDTWTRDTEIRLSRTITVTKAGSDVAFGSEVEFDVPMIRNLADYDVFIPGIWYATAATTPRSGLITDVDQRDFILREDRMPLPMISISDIGIHTAFTLRHCSPNGATISTDDTLARLIDERLQFGSLGVRRRKPTLSVLFCFPGSEGEQTSIFGYKPDKRTVERLHPIKLHAKQSYQLAFSLQPIKSFADQMKLAWRTGYGDAKPEVAAFDAKTIYDASIGVLDHYWYERGEVAGFPFSVSLPDGVMKDPSLQMGFVGQQLPCASYLIDEGIRSGRKKLVEKGEKIVDFWAKNSFNEQGVPRTWFDLEPTPHWRNYNTFLRVVTDGTSGMLRAWQIERAAGRDKPDWLAFSRRVGDWLVHIQNLDGSFYREWKFDGTPASQSTTSTLHPVRLLVDLSCATGEKAYLDSAIRAAEFAVKENESGARYVGGTPDNPDVLDKEAGWIAMDSYLALYDVTQDKRWLSAATDAATFTETWIYGWNVPLPIDKQNVGVPRVKTYAGTNLIATGHSGVDNFLAYASFSYTRLWIYTGDDHFRDIAKLLQHNSAQFIETGKQGNALGYVKPGLQVEAFSLAVNRGHSVRTWLPWLTSATLEPMARMRETFGVMDVEAVGVIDIAELKRQNSLYARDRGYRSPAAR